VTNQYRTHKDIEIDTALQARARRELVLIHETEPGTIITCDYIIGPTMNIRAALDMCVFQRQQGYMLRENTVVRHGTRYFDVPRLRDNRHRGEHLDERQVLTSATS
jgi:hypothetical protein